MELLFEAVRNARIFHRLPLLEPKVGRAITADETRLKVNGRHLFVWATIDVDSSLGRY